MPAATPRRPSQAATAGRRLLYWTLIVACVFALASTGVAADAGTVDVGVNATDEVELNATTTATIETTNAATGVSAYDLTVESTNTSVLTLTNVSVHGEGTDGPLVNETRTADNGTLTLSVALLDAAHEPAPNATTDLVDVDLVSHTTGSANVSVTAVDTITNESVDPYTVTLEPASAIDVAEPDPPSGNGGGGAPPPPPDDDDDDVTTPEPDAVFDITGVTPTPDTVEAGASVDIAVDIANAGDGAGTQSVDLTIGDAETVSQSVELAAGETTTVTFSELETADLDGEYTLTVTTADDEHTATLTVTAVDTPTPETEPDGPTADETPGFGAVVALVAVLAAALIAARRPR